MILACTICGSARSTRSATSCLPILIAEHLEQGTQLIDDTEIRVRLLRDWGWLFRRPKERTTRSSRTCSRPRARRAISRALERACAVRNDPGGLHPAALQSAHRDVDTRAVARPGDPTGLRSLGTPASPRNSCGCNTAGRATSTRTTSSTSQPCKSASWSASTSSSDQLDHVFVDEFQDTNPIQAAIHLGWPRTVGARLTVVGDDDQALYRFRGSDIACFANLKRDCPRAACLS